ncbi:MULTISPECIES: exonuclease domain-containing protein [unclassified Bacillus (in: firmicutes)]|uniref:exonuclease domain-containing protein n=1 Tax=unclassified Bacillus (in: firmicutes) TaxID=185979 RepID=UPI0008F23485|nr:MULTISPECIES: exonuclease domain-containing protein [unclassified Bacillus (in: firmicutes)]SFB06873.1 DNA polymerase-3 subunit epsilon [Bacillus sp. UNCCL13]SFQ87542.1 DNA polymerase-3 subunit epsilon [Bacillus sp. cl95]
MGLNEMLQFFRQMSGKLGSNVYAGVQGQVSPQHISFMRQLQREMKEKSTLDLPLKDLPVVVFDIETTGFHPEKGDYVISIGAIKMIGEEIIESDTFYSLIKSHVPLPYEISKLTNIQDEDLLIAPEASEVLINFLKFINSSILVAHHAKHEQIFMQRMTLDLLRTKFEHRVIDTSFLMRIVDPNVKALSLEEACSLCEVEIRNRHHALWDARMTAEIWSFYLKKATDAGFHQLRDVYEQLAKL